MKKIRDGICKYLEFCSETKRLDKKTVKAYKLDLKLMLEFFEKYNLNNISEQEIYEYILYLHDVYKPKTVKRKITVIKMTFIYLKKQGYNYEIENICEKYNFRQPKTLPKVIELYNVKKLYNYIYEKKSNNSSDIIKRDIAIIELLLATGIRVSELCELNISDIDTKSMKIKIYGKGSKERILTIGNPFLLKALHEYEDTVSQSRRKYFINSKKEKISDQSVRFMINKYIKEANIKQKITPHMFRHSFATMLLEQNVDIRYIQKMLGHSSIQTTEIYTYVSMAKQAEILKKFNPRNMIV